MIEVIYNGNLGNNLFQYCFGRILAETLGYRLSVPPIPGFPRTYDTVDGHDYSDRPVVTLRGQRPDLSFLEDSSGLQYRFLLTGYFQRYEYYRPHAARIREWLRTEDKVEADIGKNDVVLSIRRGRDYIPQYGLPLSYYENALSLLKYEAVHICTNEPGDPFIRYLTRKYGALVRPGSFQGGRLRPDYLAGALDNLIFIGKFNKIVISNSSFAWWAAYLSRAEEIIYPRPASGMWAPNDPISRNMDLEVDEERYTYLSCERYKSEFLSESVRNNMDATIAGARARIRKWFPFVTRKIKRPEGGREFRFHDEQDEHCNPVGKTP